MSDFEVDTEADITPAPAGATEDRGEAIALDAGRVSEENHHEDGAPGSLVQARAGLPRFAAALH